jgi:hypothetical protein
VCAGWPGRAFDYGAGGLELAGDADGDADAGGLEADGPDPEGDADAPADHRPNPSARADSWASVSSSTYFTSGGNVATWA